MNREKYEAINGDLGHRHEGSYHGRFRHGWKQFEGKAEFSGNQIHIP